MTGPKALVLGYSNGNAVKIRGGRAAVSVCSDFQVGNPRNILPLSVNKNLCWMGRRFEVRRKSENLPAVGYAFFSVLASWDTGVALRTDFD